MKSLHRQDSLGPDLTRSDEDYAFRQINSATRSLGPINFRIEIFDNCRTSAKNISMIAGANHPKKRAGYPDIRLC
jgi:hypothetical protein